VNFALCYTGSSVAFYIGSRPSLNLSSISLGSFAIGQIRVKWFSEERTAIALSPPAPRMPCAGADFCSGSPPAAPCKRRCGGLKNSAGNDFHWAAPLLERKARTPGTE